MGNIVNICSMTGKKTAHKKFSPVFLCTLHKYMEVVSINQAGYRRLRYSVGVQPQWRLNTLVK